ncbi:ABC transporter ATP-binding protein [Pseudopelagicola sp. nBUS_20]|uniref:ABC transporter ATP-binding protein n=1 Tax=Pseudopelagicola sp. nBUS_20 TaxID=3395317 RepID=UPI003EB9939C
MKLWVHFSKNLKYFSIILTMLAFIVSILEVLGISSIVPFLAILADPSVIEDNEFISYLFEKAMYLGIGSYEDFTKVVAVSAISLFIFSILGRAFYNFLTIKFIAGCEYELSVAMFKKYVTSDYEHVIANDSAISKKNILSETFMVSEHAIAPMVTIVSQGLTLFFFLFAILIVNIYVSIIVLLFIIVLALFILLPLSYIVMYLGDRRFKYNELRFKVTNDSLSILKEIKVRGDENYFIDQFSQISSNYRKALSLMRGISIIPRYILEGVAFGSSLVAILFMYLHGTPFSEIIPIVTLYALVGYRAMPALQNIYTSFTAVRSMRGSVRGLLAQLEHQKTNQKVNPVNEKWDIIGSDRVVPTVFFDRVSYNFPESDKTVIEDLTLELKPGQCVGIVGKTGSGKTTLINILMGLFPPSKGSLKYQINDNTYSIDTVPSVKYGYVSQNIVLVDRSLAENVSLTETDENINYERLRICLKISDLTDVVDKLDEGVHTFVGERGVRLSGGQRQRVAIARALYAEPSILVFDEATSALDIETEKVIIDNIRELSSEITIIMIAHRPQSLRICDKIYEMNSGKISLKDAKLVVKND